MDKLFENTDETLLRWRMSVEEEDSAIADDDDGTAEPLLKTVVRTSYLYHLRQSLRKNLESSKQKNVCDIEENMINKVIKGCSALLEEKALRNCMIARLYQRVMAQTIKEVKKATNDGQLYSSLKEFADRQSQISATAYSDKEIQTDDVYFHPFPPVCQQPVSSEAEKISDSLTVKQRQTSHSLDKFKQPRTINGISKADHRSMRSKDLITKSGIPQHNYRKASNENIIHNENMNHNGVEYNGNLADSGSLVPSNSHFQNTGVAAKHDTDSVPELNASSASNKNEAFQLKLRSPNFVECVAYWYNVECELEELPPWKRQKLDEKFIQLFGKDHAIDYYFLTDEQKSITCRKRIAKYVVIELTNYYNQKKIASKQLFKTMAKHITSILLGRSLFPDPAQIKRSVEEFFFDGRIIKSEDDFYF